MTPPVPLPVVPIAIESAVLDGEPTLLVVGDSATVQIDPRSGSVVRFVHLGGVGATAADIDGDGRDEILVCGSAGVVAVTREGTQIIVPGRCEAIARTDSELVVVDGSVHLYSLPAGAPGGLVDRGPWGPHLGGSPRIAIDGALLAVGSAVSAGLDERSPDGHSSIATGGSVAGIARVAGTWAWTVADPPALMDADGHEVRLGAAPGRVVDTVAGVAVLHPGWVGLVMNGQEGQIAVSGHPIGLANVTAGACSRLAVVSDAPPTIQFDALGDCAAMPVANLPAVPIPEPAPDEPPLPPPKTVRILGSDLPAFVGLDPNDRNGWPRATTQIGIGGVIGGTLGPVWTQIGAFPALALVYERGGPRARFFAGLDSAGFFLWAGESVGGVHLGNATLGAMFGGPDLALGAFGTVGVLDAGAGLRATMLPWTARGGSKSGFEARLTWFTPRTGEAMLLYVWRDSSNAPPRELSPDVTTHRTFCSRFEVMAGGSIAASSTSASWEFVGRGNNRAFAGGPALGIACEQDGAGAAFISAETAPLTSYLVPTEGDRIHHMASVSVGLMVGSDAVRLGPIAQAGFWTLGAGGRVVIAPIRAKGGSRQGFDLRALVLAPGGPSFEAIAGWGVWIDPRR